MGSPGCQQLGERDHPKSGVPSTALKVLVPQIQRAKLTEIVCPQTSEFVQELRERLADVKGVKVRDRGRVCCGIVTLTKDGEDATAIRQRLSAEAINVTISTASSSRYDRRWLIHGPVLRASLHYYNSCWEIERFCSTLNPR